MPLPTSDALSEASPGSLSELFSRDPEGFQQQDLDRLIVELRAMRERFLQAEAAGATAKRGAKSAPTVIVNSPEDLGL